MVVYMTIKITKEEAEILKNNVMREIWRFSPELDGVNVSYAYIIRRMRKHYLKGSRFEV